MAEGQQPAQDNSNPQNPGSEGGKTEKLLAGKFKSPEELEQGYRELERSFHSSRQENREVLDRLDRLESRVAQPPVDEGYGRGRDVAPVDDGGTQLLTEFYTAPQKVLQSVEERAAAKAEQRIQQRQRAERDYAERVNAWAAQNSDVTPYGDLLTFYVGQTDARLSPERRLDAAAEKVRVRVKELRGSKAPSEPNPDEFVDGATGTRGAAPQRGSAPAQPQGQEDELARHVAEHNQHIARPLGLAGRK